MKRRAVALVLVLASLSAGCSATNRDAAAGHLPVAVRPVPPVDTDGGADASDVRRLSLARSTTLTGEPGGVAADRAGTVVAVDNDSLVALDNEDVEVWTTPVPGAGLGKPLLADGLVVVPTLRDDAGAGAGAGAGGCVALDRAGGERVWSYEEPASAGVAVARAGHDILCALNDGVVVALDRATGRRRWRSVVARGAARSAVSIAERTALAVDEKTGRVVLAASVGRSWVAADLDLVTGVDRGAFDFTRVGPVSAPVSTAPGLVAIGLSGSREVCTIDLTRGRVASCVPVPVPDGFDPASVPLVAGGLLVVAGRDGSVTAIDLAAQVVRWSVRVPNPILSARPVVSGGIVTLTDWARVPWAVRLADGTPVEVPKLDGWAIGTVAGADGAFGVVKRGLDAGWVERWVPRS